MVCDIEMPSGSGLDLLAWVEKEGMPLVSILLTCHPDFSYAVTALEHGALAYLLKPFKPEELHSTIRQAIAKVRELQHIARLQKSSLQCQPDACAGTVLVSADHRNVPGLRPFLRCMGMLLEKH